MKPLWSALVRRFAALSRRERLVVAALLVIGPPLVALTLWVEPAWRSHLALQAELTASTADSARRANGPQADPNAMAKVELDSLQAQLTRDRQAVAALSHSMVAPAEMVQLLERLLARHPGVRLMAMRSLASEPWTTAGPGATPAAGANAQTGGLYRHGVELELEGGWHSLRAYLADVERSPRRLQWGELQLSAQEHPAMRMKISLHTLSLEAAWLQL